MNKYKVVVNKINTMIFDVEAIDKSEAKEIVEEMISSAYLFKLKCVRKITKYEYMIKKNYDRGDEKWKN